MVTAQATSVLGELLESRHMLPIILPSDPKFLCAVPSRRGWENLSQQPFVARDRDERHGFDGSNGTALKRYKTDFQLLPCDGESISIRSLALVDGADWRARCRASEVAEQELDTDGEENIVPVNELEVGSRPGSPHLTSLQPPLGLRRQRREVSGNEESHAGAL